MLVSNSNSSAYSRPRQDLHKSKDPNDKQSFQAFGYTNVGEWYAQNIRFISSFYNIINYPTYFNVGTNRQPTPVDEINENFNYFFGIQNNKPIIPMSDDVDYTQWMQGQKIPQLVKNITGTMQSVIQTAEWTIKNHDRGELTKRERLLQLSLLKVKFQEFFQKTEEQGVGFNPMPNMPQDAMTESEIISFAEQNIFDLAEETAYTILNRLQYDTRAVELYTRAFRHAVIGRYCGIYTYVKNGRLVKQVIPPQNIIMDMTVNNERYRRGVSIGIIEFLEPSEIFERWDLPFEEKQQIYSMAATNNFSLWQSLNMPVGVSLGFNWWNNINNKKTVACVTGFWRSFVRPDYTPVDDKEVFIHQGTLIGNKILTDYRPVENIVRNPMDLNDIQLPVQVFIPEIENGVCRSIVDRLRNLQDRVDAIEKILVQKYARDFGKVYIIKGHKAYNIDVATMLQDFKNIGVHVAVSTGEIDDYTNQERLVEVLDFTVDPNLRLYAELQQKYKQEMEEILNLSKIALGQQTSYVGAATQATSIQQSSTNQNNLMQGFINYMVEDQQYTLETFKSFALTESGIKYAEKFLSPRMINFLKKSTKFTLADLRTIVKIEDVIDTQMRQRLLMYAQAWSQNPDFPPKAVIAVETARTLSELERKLNGILDKAQMEKEKKEAIMAGMQQAAMADRNQTQLEMSQNRDNTMLQKQQMVSEADVVGKAMQVAAKTNSQNTNSNGV